MKSLIDKIVSSRAGVFLLVAAVFGIIAASGPPVQSSDTRFYLSLSDALARGDSSAFLTTRHATWTVMTLPTLLALARAVAPESWPWLMVFMNVACGAITAAMLVKLVRMTTQSTAAAAAGLLFYVASYDIVAWLRLILTDMLYGVFAIATFLVAIGGIMNDTPPARRRAGLAVLLLLCFITRPAGVILIPLVIATEYLGSLLRHTEGRSFARRALPWILAGAAAVAVLLVRAYFYDDMQRWPTDFMRPKLEELADREKTGEVVWDRKETFRPPPRSTADHVLISIDRFVRFFQFLSPGYSRMHNLVNVAYFVPLYGLGLLGVIDGFRMRDRRYRTAVQATLLWIGTVAWFHAITFLDFDWRYRLPVVPQLILLATFGVSAVARQARSVLERSRRNRQPV